MGFRFKIRFEIENENGIWVWDLESVSCLGGWGVNILTEISSITFWVLTNVFLYDIVSITVNRDCIERGII